MNHGSGLEMAPSRSSEHETDGIEALVQALLAEVEKERTKMEVSEWKIGKILEAVEALKSGGAASTMPRLPRRKKVHLKSTAHLVRTYAYEILRQTGRPMTAPEILQAMEVRGLRIPAGNAAKQIGRILWGAQEFVRTDAGYWLASETTR